MSPTKEFTIGGKLTLSVVLGDIVQTEADALISAVDHAGPWAGELNVAIVGVAGPMFQTQASVEYRFRRPPAVVAKKVSAHQGKFGDVVFVTDNPDRGLSAVVVSALTAADDSGYRHVSLPPIRMEVVLERGRRVVRALEREVRQAAAEIVSGIYAFATRRPTRSIQKISLVVHTQRQPDMYDALIRVFD